MPTSTQALASIPEVLDDLRAGKMIILVDDEHRENEGDLVLPAQFATPEAITFMLTVARGYLCVALTESDCDRLDLPPQAAENTSVRGTAFTVSIDGHPRHGFTTGVSAKERARCIQMMLDPKFTPADFVRPGHINPLRSRDGGVLVRTGQTEGSVDLCRLAGLYPAAAIIEIMKDDGEMARLPDLLALGARHGIKVASVAQIIQHRLAQQPLVKRLEPRAGTSVQTPFGPFRLRVFESMVDPLSHVALTLNVGDADLGDEPVLVRMHRRDVLGDIFWARAEGGEVRPGTAPVSGQVLHASLKAIREAGRGAVIYLRHEAMAGDEGSVSALSEQLHTIRRARAHDPGADAPDVARPEARAHLLPTHLRAFGIGGQILRDLGLRRLRLLTNHHTDLPNLEAFGLSIVERVPVR